MSRSSEDPLYSVYLLLKSSSLTMILSLRNFNLERLSSLVTLYLSLSFLLFLEESREKSCFT